VMEGNRDHLPGLVDRVAGLGIDRIVLVHAVPMPGRHPDLGPLSPAAWGTVADRVRYQGRASRIAVDLPVMPPLQPRDDTSDGPPVAAGALPDHAPWTQVSIQPDGALAWCCPVGTLPRAATVPWPLGTSFSVPWSHETFQRGRRAASAPPACGLCPQVGKECDGK
jgi:MoaA/NifB/PqqE/SkfB family radical SAM enzyme